MAKKTTIIVEDRLREIFSYLPDSTGMNGEKYTPVFKGGDEKELIAFFKQSQGNTNYPLIWLEMPYEEDHKMRTKVVLDNLAFILAVETNSEMLNSERIDTTYKQVLYPLLDNVLDAFKVGNTIEYDLNFSITKFPNYTSKEAQDGGFVDVWDAIKLTLNCTINDNCLRTIKF